MRNKLAFTYVNLANAPGYKSGRHPSADSSINHIELIAAWSLGCRRHEYRARRGAKVASRLKPLSGEKECNVTTSVTYAGSSAAAGAGSDVSPSAFCWYRSIAIVRSFMSSGIDGSRCDSILEKIVSPS